MWLVIRLLFTTNNNGPVYEFIVRREEPGRAIVERFIVRSFISCINQLIAIFSLQNALRGRENPLPDIARNLEFTLETFEASVEREIQAQFNVS